MSPKTMAKAGAGYPRLKELVDKAIATSQKKECILWKCKSKRDCPQLMVTDNNIEQGKVRGNISKHYE